VQGTITTQEADMYNDVKRALVSQLIESRYENPNRTEARWTAELTADEIIGRFGRLLTPSNAATFAEMVA
jgi:hypothetical protein